MAGTKKKKEEEKFLHCKCNSCKTWEVGYDSDTGYFLKCVSCDKTFPVKFKIREPHSDLHWGGE